MAITGIPTTQKTPLFYAEMDYTGASAPNTSGPTLIMGTMLSGGTGTANLPVQVFSAAEVSGLFGRGSEIHREAVAYMGNDRAAGEVWVVGLAETTTAAEGLLTIGGAATAAGVLHLEIAGVVLDIPVASGDANTVVATAIDAALPAHGVTPNDYQVSGVAAVGVVTLTAKSKGETSNGISVLLNPLGSAGRQTLPTGITCVITKMGVTTEGSGNPSLTAALAAFDGVDADFIIAPWSDITSLASYKAYMSDQAGRWFYEIQQYGHVWISRFGSAAELLAIDPNDQHLTMIGIEGVNNTGNYDQYVPNLPSEVLAAYVGQCAKILRVDPAKPCQTQELLDDLTGLIAFRGASKLNAFSIAERNSLINGGVATVTYDNQSNIKVERAVTSYTEDAFGNGAFLDVQPLYTSMFVLRTWKAAVEANFGQSKITATTTQEIKALLVAKHEEMEAAGLVVNTQLFAVTLVVEVNATDPNRIDVSASPDYVNQLRVVALANNFIV